MVLGHLYSLAGQCFVSLRVHHNYFITEIQNLAIPFADKKANNPICCSIHDGHPDLKHSIGPFWGTFA
jgi:hypothetical protein